MVAQGGVEGGQAVGVGRRITVADREVPVGLAERQGEVAQGVDLAVPPLPLLAVHRSEVVAVDGGGSRGEGAGRALGGVAVVPGHTVFRHHRRPHEFQAVQLTGHLEERAAVLRSRVQLEDVADGLVRDLEGALAGRSARCRSQLSKGWGRESADLEGPAVDP
jgi:hypothetical protein